MEAAFRGCIVITKGNEMTNEIAVLDQTVIATVFTSPQGVDLLLKRIRDERHPRRLT